MENREIIIAGNWKMYKTSEQAADFIQKLRGKVKGIPHSIYLAVPFTAISPAALAAAGSNICIGAQNMHSSIDGAFTGEISAYMLISAGAKFVILGHSERRHLFHETNEFINEKVKTALKEGIRPILCIGETLKEFISHKTKSVLEKQLVESLAGLKAEELKTLVIAYEPVWAIGTGKTATPEIAEEVHAFCRQLIRTKWGIDLSIIYGGSVKPENTAALMRQENIDGVLVGGASLDPDSFAKIIQY